MAAERVSVARLEALVDIAAGRRIDQLGEILHHSEQAHNSGMLHARSRANDHALELQNTPRLGSLSNIAVEAQSQESVTLVGDDGSEAAADLRGWFTYERAVERNRMEAATPQDAILAGAGSAFVLRPYPEEVPQTIGDIDLNEQEVVDHTRQELQANHLNLVIHGDGNRFHTRTVGSVPRIREHRSTTSTNNQPQRIVAPVRGEHSSVRKQG